MIRAFLLLILIFSLMKGYAQEKNWKTWSLDCLNLEFKTPPDFSDDPLDGDYSNCTGEVVFSNDFRMVIVLKTDTSYTKSLKYRGKFSNPDFQYTVYVQDSSNFELITTWRNIIYSISVTEVNVESIHDKNSLVRRILGTFTTKYQFVLLERSVQDGFFKRGGYENLVGVKFSDNRKEIDMSGKNLAMKKIPAHISEFEQVEIVNLANNELSYIPSFIFNMKIIKGLNLSFNQLYQLPDVDICRLSSLEYLNIGNNPISELPACFSSLKNLKELNLENTHLSDIPEFFKNMGKMKIYVRNSDIPKATRKNLKKQFPEINFVF
jgi:hypothetical protein